MKKDDRFCLIGNPLGHSFSKEIHTRLGCFYDLVQLEESELEKFAKKGSYDGFNVTIPFKQKILPYMNCLDESAKQTGAVNTVVRRNGRLVGYNTDFKGILFALKRASIEIKGKKAAILGSGGTSATAKAVVQSLNARETVVISQLGQNNYSNLDQHFDSEVVINTTPVGMFPENKGELIDLDDFFLLEGVLDVVYNPLRTNLVLKAENDGIHCSGGLPMLVAQAFYSREIFTGEPALIEDIERFLTQFQKEKENIVLVGMPGSGKTTIGKEVAKRLHRDFVDTDDLVVSKGSALPKALRSIPVIFGEGEELFRQLECEAVADCAKKFSGVIATGGGAVLDERNVNALRQNGIVFYLERKPDFNNCSTDRPLVGCLEDLEYLHETRQPYYEQAADFVVSNDGTVEECVSKIANCSVQITNAAEN